MAAFLPQALNAYNADPAEADDGALSFLPLAQALRLRAKQGGIEAGDGSVLPQARKAAASVPAGPVEQARVPNNFGALTQGYDQKITDYQRQLGELNQDPDYTEMASASRQRGGEGVQALAASIAAGMGPRDLQPLQQHFAQQSTRLMAPQKIEGGEIDASGNVTIDPGFKRQKQISDLRGAIEHLEKAKLTATTAEEKYRIEEQQNKMMMEFRNAQLQMQKEAHAGRIALAGAAREANGGAGKMQAHGVTPDGRMVSYSPQLGRTFVANPNGDGVVEYTGPLLSQGTADKNVLAAQHLQSTGATIDAIEATVKQHPRAFGGVTSLAALTPDIIQSRILSANLTPEERAARGLVLQQAAETVNQLYGAALSSGESARASAFVPDAKDNAPTILSKLQAARQWQQSKLKALGPFATQARNITGAADEPGSAAAQSGNVNERKQSYY